MARLQITGWTALVTGASAGIGAEFSKQLHAAGAHVILVARRVDRLRESAAKFNAERPGSASYLGVDLNDEALEIFAADSDGRGGLEDFVRRTPIDLLVNNAGFGSFGVFDALPLEREAAMVRVNVLAPVKLSHAVIPGMKARKRGAIINVSSIAAFQPIPMMTTYAATKAFNLHHSVALRRELKPFGVRVLALCPGPTATEFGVVAEFPGTVNSFKRPTTEKVVRDALSGLAGGRMMVIPTWQAKMIALPGMFLPHRVTTAVTGWMMRRFAR